MIHEMTDPYGKDFGRSDDAEAKIAPVRLRPGLTRMEMIAYDAGWDAAMAYMRVSPEGGLKDASAEAWQAGYLRGTLDNESDLEPADNPYRLAEDDLCHCGAPVSESPEVPMAETLGPAARALCEDCLPVRCDAYPGACKR